MQTYRADFTHISAQLTRQSYKQHRRVRAVSNPRPAGVFAHHTAPGKSQRVRAVVQIPVCVLGFFRALQLLRLLSARPDSHDATTQGTPPGTVPHHSHYQSPSEQLIGHTTLYATSPSITLTVHNVMDGFHRVTHSLNDITLSLTAGVRPCLRSMTTEESIHIERPGTRNG